MTKETRGLLLTAVFIFALFSPVFAQEEAITITTYYPSPYGSYNELTSNKIKVGRTYSGSAVTVSDDNLIVEGSIGIGQNNPSEKLDVNGNVTASAVYAGAFYYSSDTRLKKDIRPINNAAEKILSLKGISFRWKADDRASLGLLAQDLEKVFPELVYTNKQGLRYVEYTSLIAPLIEAVKEQQEQITALKKEIRDLKIR